MPELAVRIETLPPMRVARFHATGQHPEHDAWTKLQDWAGPLDLLKDPKSHPVFGFNNPSPASPGQPYGYEFWIRIAPEMQVSTGIETANFPGGSYAVTTSNGPPDLELWMRLLHWVRKSPFHHRRDHELERPHNPLAPVAEMVFDLCLPIEQPSPTPSQVSAARAP